MGDFMKKESKQHFLLSAKARTLIEQRNDESLSVEVYMDGAYVNGYIRPKSRKEDRINRHKAEIVIIIVRLLHNIA